MANRDFLAIDKNSKGRNAMHVKGFLHRLLSTAIHNRRLQALSEVIEAAIEAKHLSLTTLGRSINLPIQERSAIQKVNRIFRNPHLLMDYSAIAKLISSKLIGNKKHPCIIVDWTKYPNSCDAVIRSAIEVEGRAITLYEERHNEKSIGKRGVQTRFLNNLKKILPDSCIPIIVTDAGFHNAWFSRLVNMGWHYIGRVRGVKMYQSSANEEFKSCKKLYKLATKEVKSLGKMMLTKNNKFETNFYLIKCKAKGRKAFTCRGKWRSDKDSLDYARSHREPWLLVSSLDKDNSGKKVVSIYKRRMGIEEAFRDLKSIRYGFSLRSCVTIKKMRRDNVLLIAMLANLVVMLIGSLGERMKLQYQFQSNSIRHRRVLSIFYLGCQLIRKKINLTVSAIWEILTSLPNRMIHD
jgi:hypothetical protein